MATAAPDIEQPLDMRGQIVRIDKMQAELQRRQVEVNKLVADTAKSQVDAIKVRQDTRLAPFTLAFTGLGAGAALFAAGGAFFKLLG